MKKSWIILLLLLIIIISAAIVLCLFFGWLTITQSTLIMALLLIFGIILPICIIIWLALKKTKPKTQQQLTPTATVETPRQVEQIKTEPAPTQEILTTAQPAEEIKTEISQTQQEIKEEIKQEIPQTITQAPASVQETKDRGSRIVEIEGIGPINAKKLNDINIYTTTDLLEAGETPTQRREIAQKTGIDSDRILRWINMADLFRIKGVGEEYSDLLEAAGVDTVVELSKRVPENLHAKMLEVNAKQNLVRRPPPLGEVNQWIAEAKTLPRKIQY